jgi:hypothetical protein
MGMRNVIFSIILLFFSFEIFSQNVLLNWNTNTDPDLAGYRVYYGNTAPRVYGTPTDVGNSTSYTVRNLPNGTYFFAVTAYDLSNNESGYSNEATKTLSSSSPFPSTPGWYELPNTNIRSVAPPNNYLNSGYDFTSFVTSHIDAWNSGAFDTLRDRMITFGGGHNDYFGNEIYAISLDPSSIQRIIGPAVPIAPNPSCIESLASGTQPNSRHTYDAVAYMENIDSLFVYGGSLASCGNASNSVWIYHFSTNVWEKMAYSGGPPRYDYGVVSAYDPNTGRVYLQDNNQLWYYDYATNHFTQAGAGYGIPYNYMKAVVDPVNKKLVIVGAATVRMYDIAPGSQFVQSTLNTSGGTAIVNASAPGLAFDPVSQKIIAWNEGPSVYSLDLSTRIWTQQSFGTGPPPRKPTCVGTFNRWGYSPNSGVFVEVNNVDNNAWVLRLGSSSSVVPSTPGGVQVH